MTRWSACGLKVSMVERGERDAAAVLSSRAAARFGLQVLADGIESFRRNRTRHLIVAMRQGGRWYPGMTFRL